MTQQFLIFTVFAAMVFAATDTAAPADDTVTHPSATSTRVRFATYNVSLFGKQSGDISRRLASGMDRHATQLARVIQSVRPDVLFLNEIDYEADAKPLSLFAEKYLAVDQQESQAIEYPYRYSIPSNTGVDSAIDLNGDGKSEGPNDAWGYGVYPGQYAMAVLSRFPLERDAIRTFQMYRWNLLPDALRPMHPTTGESFYRDEVWSQLRLSSKNHVDIPIRINNHIIHLLGSHPTPPVFDGPADHNGCRNHDEVRFWVDYLDGDAAMHVVDDSDRKGGLPHDAWFVIVGDLNSDATNGAGRPDAIARLLAHRRVNDVQPRHVLKVGADDREPRLTTTADFGGKNGLRVDYVLPSRQLMVRDCGVFWPAHDDPRRAMVSVSDHRLVWIDVELPN